MYITGASVCTKQLSRSKIEQSPFADPCFWSDSLVFPSRNETEFHVLYLWEDFFLPVVLNCLKSIERVVRDIKYVTMIQSILKSVS